MLKGYPVVALGVQRGGNRHATGVGSSYNEPAVHSVRGRQPAVWQPPSNGAAEASERAVVPKQRQASATAGLGTAFVAAASPKLRPGEGRLALVLPATVCTGPSWEQTRSLIERNFVLGSLRPTIRYGGTSRTAQTSPRRC